MLPPLPAIPPAVDKFGRRFLFIEGGVQMASAQVRAHPQGGLAGRAARRGCCMHRRQHQTGAERARLASVSRRLPPPCAPIFFPLPSSSYRSSQRSSSAPPRPPQIVTGVVLAKEFGADNKLPHGTAIGVLVVICVFVAGFAWSWGPLGWLVPSEIQTLETRAAGAACPLS